MAPVKRNKNVVSALHARANFGKLLRTLEEERGSLVIEKRGTPKAVTVEHSRIREARRSGAGGVARNRGRV